MSERWAHTKRMVSTLWAHAEWNLASAYEQKTLSKCRAQIEKWTHVEWYVNALWKQDEWFIQSSSYVILSYRYPRKCFVNNQEKINYMFIYCYQPKYNISWLMNAERWTLCGCTVSAFWMMSANSKEENTSEGTVSAWWTHFECTAR